MKLAIVKELSELETRVALAPQTVKDYTSLGFEVVIETKAGERAGFSDDDYKDSGAIIAKNSKEAFKDADIVLKVNAPTKAEIKNISSGAVLVAAMSALQNPALAKDLAAKNISSFSMELIPRITRAQSMDILSSQSNLAGYKAVIDAVAEYGEMIPMMMTAAGTIKPANILILGAGVAGLQAIATAKRLGAVVSAFDVRSAAKEQVESLGAGFVEVKNEGDLETKGGYAKEMDDEYKKRQAALIHQTVKNSDIVICTALIPGKKAPILITKAMVKDMKPGSVIVDLAAINGGNCEFSEKNKIVEKQGVKIIGHENMAGRLAKNASILYANNLYAFIENLIDSETQNIKIDLEDEIIKGTLISHKGNVVHPSLT